MNGEHEQPPRERVLRLVHHHPGRIRVRADVFVANGVVFELVRKAIENIPGVSRVTHNAQTGSVLIEYSPGLAEPDEIITVAAETAGLDGVRDEVNGPGDRADPARIVIDTVRGLNRAANEVTGGRADLGVIVPAALAAAAVVSFVTDANGPRMPRWDNLSYWAYQVFLEWQRRKIARPETAPATAAT
jgi:hypothetical protein